MQRLAELVYVQTPNVEVLGSNLVRGKYYLDGCKNPSNIKKKTESSQKHHLIPNPHIGCLTDPNFQNEKFIMSSHIET